MGLFRKPVRVGLIQMQIRAGDKQKNIDRALARIDESCRGGAKIVVLPECFSTGINLTSLKRDAEEIQHSPVVQTLCEKACQNGIYLCAGILEKEQDQIYDSLILISPDGVITYTYRRSILWKMEGDFFQPGLNKPGCIDTEIGRIGFLLGYELYFPELCRELYRQEPDIIICPANILKIASSPVETLCRARAEENHCYFLFVSCLGYHLFTNSNYIGNSMITCNSSYLIYELKARRAHSTGLVAKAGEDEGVLFGDLELTKLQRHRKKNNELQDLLLYMERSGDNRKEHF